MAGTQSEKQPTLKTENKVGNTVYYVSGFFAAQGVTVSEKIRGLLDRETKRNHA